MPLSADSKRAMARQRIGRAISSGLLISGANPLDRSSISFYDSLMKKYLLFTGITILSSIQIIAFIAAPSAASSTSDHALVGCFAKESSIGDLTLLPAVTTSSECVAAAKTASASVFALQGGTRCFVGKNFPRGAQPVPCEPCRENPSVMCGVSDDDHHHLAVYKLSPTPIASTEADAKTEMKKKTVTVTLTLTDVVDKDGEEVTRIKPTKPATTPSPNTVVVYKTKTVTSTAKQPKQ